MKGFNATLKQRGAIARRPQQDQRADRHGARRLHQRRRHRADRREDRPEDARGAVAPGPQGVRPRRRRPARRLDAAARSVRCVSARRRLRDPSRDRFPEHGLRASAVPDGSQGGDVRVDSRATRTEERKPKDTEEQFIYKARKKAIGPFKQQHVEHQRPTRARRSAQSLEERFTFLMKQLKINDTAAVVSQVRARCRRCRSIAKPRSSPPAARSRRPRRKPKGSPTSRLSAGPASGMQTARPR